MYCLLLDAKYKCLARNSLRAGSRLWRCWCGGVARHIVNKAVDGLLILIQSSDLQKDARGPNHRGIGSSYICPLLPPQWH